MYNNAGRVASASKYGHNVYSNALETFLSDTTPSEETIFRVLGTYMKYHFWRCEIPMRIPQILFLLMTHV